MCRAEPVHQGQGGARATHSAYTLAMAVAVALAISVATASALVSTLITSGSSQMYAVASAAAPVPPQIE